MIDLASLTLDLNTTPEPSLQQEVEVLDSRLRSTVGMHAEQTSVALLDLRTGRLALLRADKIFYAASVPKIAILLGWFEAHPQPEDTDAATKHELGLMIKQSSNELAAKYSQLLTLAGIRRTLDRYALYDGSRGGGLWLGKHYSKDGERVADPVGGFSHAATARQVLRFYLLLEQGKLVSPAASAAMRDVFRSPDIPHKEDKFVAGLAGRGLEIRRKAGWWEDWAHDSAAVTGPERHYLLVALTRHVKGEDYLRALAAAIDHLLQQKGPP